MHFNVKANPTASPFASASTIALYLCFPLFLVLAEIGASSLSRIYYTGATMNPAKTVQGTVVCGTNIQKIRLMQRHSLPVLWKNTRNAIREFGSIWSKVLSMLSLPFKWRHSTFFVECRLLKN